MQPLADITVVAVEQAVAGPFATRHLADLGARVIKVERLGAGDFARHYDGAVKGMSSHFVWLNRSKESMTLDVKTAEGKQVLGKLLDRADVLVSNLGPGAMERLGFASDTVRQSYPHMITCEISGYGASGPYQDRKAYDLLVQAESGLLSITGTDASPAKVGISVADIAAGMYAYSGILTALLKRHATGEGSTVEVSLLEALGEWMGYPAYYASYGGAQPPRTGTRHATIAPYGDIKIVTGDGGSVFLAVQNEREWERFCDIVIGRPELTKDSRFRTNSVRVDHRDALFELIESVFRGLTTPEVVERLIEADIAYAEVNDVIDFVRHPQLAARDRWCEVDSPVGRLSALVPPADIEDVEPTMAAIPDVGEHTDKILLNLGYRSEDIERFRREGVI